MTTLPGSGQPTTRDPVEDGAERDELVNPLGALVDENTNRGLVTQSCAGTESIGQVEVRRVLIARKDRGYASLSPTSRRLLELTLG
jgi:hypothetical protein